MSRSNLSSFVVQWNQTMALLQICRPQYLVFFFCSDKLHLTSTAVGSGQSMLLASPNASFFTAIVPSSLASPGFFSGTLIQSHSTKSQPLSLNFSFFVDLFHPGASTLAEAGNSPRTGFSCC